MSVDVRDPYEYLTLFLVLIALAGGVYLFLGQSSDAPVPVKAPRVRPIVLDDGRWLCVPDTRKDDP